MNKMKYQRFLKPGFKPFDPLELAKTTEKIVTRKGKEGLERKYVGIYSAPVYRGIARICRRLLLALYLLLEQLVSGLS